MKTFQNSEANLFQNNWKCLEVPRAQTNSMKDIPSFTKIGHCILIREANIRFTFDVDKKHTYICTDSVTTESGPSSIAGGPQSVIEVCSYFLSRGVTKILAPG